MANSIDTKRIVQEAWISCCSQYQPKWQKVMRDLVGPSGTVMIGAMIMGAVPQVIADNATTGAAASDFASFQATFTTQEKVVKHTFATHLLQSDITLRSTIGDFANTVMAGVDLDAFGGLEGLLTAAHPRVGTGVGQVGATKKYIDTAKKALQGESGEFVYSNRVAAALSRTSVGTAVALMSGWKSDRGLPMNMGNAGYTLVCNPADEVIAHEIARSTLSSNAMQSNYFLGLITNIVTFPFVTATTGWFLIANGQAPFGYRLAKFPQVELREGEDGTISHLVATYNGCFAYSPYEYGLVGSSGS